MGEARLGEGPHGGEDVAEARAGPQGGADERSADRVRDARERDEAADGGVAGLELCEGEGRRLCDEAADAEPPGGLVDLRRRQVDVDAVVVLRRRVLEARAGHRRDRGAGVGERDRRGDHLAPSSCCPRLRSTSASSAPATAIVAVSPADPDDEAPPVEAGDLGADPVAVGRRGRDGRRDRPRLRLDEAGRGRRRAVQPGDAQAPQHPLAEHPGDDRRRADWALAGCSARTTTSAATPSATPIPSPYSLRARGRRCARRGRTPSRPACRSRRGR